MFLNVCARIVIYRIISLRGWLTSSLSPWLTKFISKNRFRWSTTSLLFTFRSTFRWTLKVLRRKHPIWTKRCLKLNLFFFVNLSRNFIFFFAFQKHNRWSTKTFSFFPMFKSQYWFLGIFYFLSKSQSENNRRCLNTRLKNSEVNKFDGENNLLLRLITTFSLLISL